VGWVWGGYPRISDFGFRFWVLVYAHRFSGSDTRNLTGLGRILIFTHGSTVGAPESSTSCQARQLTQLGHTRAAQGPHGLLQEHSSAWASPRQPDQRQLPREWTGQKLARGPKQAGSLHGVASSSYRASSAPSRGSPRSPLAHNRTR
jgi:hypothetical protein